MIDYKLCTIPVETSSTLSGNIDDPVSDPTYYHSLAGALIHSLDISYAVQQVCLHKSLT
jgi:hypothetical protein